GLRAADDTGLETLIADETTSIVAGLESLRSPDELQKIVTRVGSKRVVFSLDLKAGEPLGNVALWPKRDPRSIAEHAIEDLGVRRLIVLDLACVGVGAGIGTEDLCERLKQRFPEIQLIAGGGVRGIDDVARLCGLGVDRVLAASALHDGRITPG